MIPAQKTRRVAFDTECGGAGELQCTTHALLSVGCAVYDAEGVLQTFHQLILPEPGLIISPEAVAVNGYSRERWEAGGAMSEGLALVRLVAWLAQLAIDDAKLVAVAHNAGHDRGFLMAALDRKGNGWREAWEKLISRRWRCSCAALGYLQDAGVLPDEDGASLDALTALRTGQDLQHVKAVRGTHSADYDARQCLEGYEWLLKLGKHAVEWPPEDGTPAGSCARLSMVQIN